MSELNLSEARRWMEQTRTSKWGWGILITLSVMLVLNGIGWFFYGGMLATFEQDTGVRLSEFRQAYPTVAGSIATNARQVAIWFVAFGLLALLVALDGYRNSSRWAWTAMWVLVGAPTAVGINVLLGGETAYGLAVITVAAVALLGLLLSFRPVSTK